MIRRLEYEEIVKTNSIRAVGYLQTRLSDIIDHKDPDQLSEFHKLASLLFKCYDAPTSTASTPSTSAPTPTSALSSNDVSTSSPTSALSTPSTSSPTAMSISPSEYNNFKYPVDWSSMYTNYQNYTPPLPTICCYGANTLKKDAELFTNKTEEQQNEMRKERCSLFNKLIELMPDHLVQPKGNLADYILIN